jgi:prefoldin subunit 5
MEGGQEIAVPKAEFISDVAALVGDNPIEPLLKELQERYSQYKMVETQCAQRKQRLIAKLPEIEKALDIVKLLLEKQGAGAEVLADYELADNVYAKAKLESVASVNLWLGAKVMVEYPLEEAREVLETQLSNCRTNIKTQSSNLDLLRDNIITTEVRRRLAAPPGAQQQFTVAAAAAAAAAALRIGDRQHAVRVSAQPARLNRCRLLARASGVHGAGLQLRRRAAAQGQGGGQGVAAPQQRCRGGRWRRCRACQAAVSGGRQVGRRRG